MTKLRVPRREFCPKWTAQNMIFLSTCAKWLIFSVWHQKKVKHDKTWECHVKMLAPQLNPKFKMFNALS